ncbi:MAG: hypothetical protein H8D61_02350 [Deltaproteobacteria bacterium]|nr:hypothetical protein [Deltaproteobacteria bacterium]
MKEKRKIIRSLDKISANFIINGRQHAGTILNIGKGSAFINTWVHFPLETP